MESNRLACAQVQKLIVSQTERDATELEKQTVRAFQLEKDRDELARRVDSLQTQLQHADLKCALLPLPLFVLVFVLVIVRCVHLR